VIALGIGFNVHILYTFDGYKKKPLELLAAGFGISLWAGVMEEICFRWLIFFGTIYTAPVFDWIFFGFAGYHPLQALYRVLGVVANFFTFGYLKEYLLGGFGWTVAMALIMTNGRFRNGHGYQGLPGMAVSWFMGMYFFWITFTYGLVAAIVIHFLYDLAIFSLVSLDAMFEERSVIERHRRRRIKRRAQELTVSA
jgi:hypothetical protein